MERKNGVVSNLTKTLKTEDENGQCSWCRQYKIQHQKSGCDGHDEYGKCNCTKWVSSNDDR